MVVSISPYRRFCLLAAGANFSREELQSLLLILRSRDIRKIQTDVTELWPSSALTFVPNETFQNDMAGIGSSTGASDIYSRITRLLIEDARITKGQAAEKIRLALKARFPKKKSPPYNSKLGFSSWLNMLSTLFSEAEILYAATKVRNDLSHPHGDDWLSKDS